MNTTKNTSSIPPEFQKGWKPPFQTQERGPGSQLISRSNTPTALVNSAVVLPLDPDSSSFAAQTLNL
ncbi:hypothetical protein EXIGLDRAFT_768711 [Exidia glandulosa HHB12029]|uniref:Uncharacterized protein n=1 Tax=Exidia glandulosa HHB12029 TaxID=1314781 RepID=A0A165HZY5_EXIGL|nr:hypothetical protein EXIGLDRAFT_768711 [Exidia glandulosa HHB12029]